MLRQVSLIDKCIKELTVLVFKQICSPTEMCVVMEWKFKTSAVCRKLLHYK